MITEFAYRGYTVRTTDKQTEIWCRGHFIGTADNAPHAQRIIDDWMYAK